MIRNATLTFAGLGLVTLLAMPAHAAPPMGADIAAGAGKSNVEKAASYGRRCWRRHGKLYCRRYVRRAYPYAYYNSGPSWGYSPGISFYFGGGNRGWHGGHHHRGWHGGHHHRGGGRHHR